MLCYLAILLGAALPTVLSSTPHIIIIYVCVFFKFYVSCVPRLIPSAYCFLLRARRTRSTPVSISLRGHYRYQGGVAILLMNLAGLVQKVGLRARSVRFASGA